MPTSATTETDPADLRQQNEADLALVDRALSDCLGDEPGRPDRLVEAMRYAVLGPGKQLRPRLALLAARACSGQPEAALGVATAVELIHAYSLVHDDLPAMDDDDLRRGRPTCHRQFDEATAILVGDALQPLAFQQITTHTKPAEVAAQCCAELAQAIGAAGLVGGQVDDLAGVAGSEQSDVAPVDWLRQIHRRKTGALISVALRLGALTATATENQLEAIERYGQALGLAFQVTDDLLDAEGSAEAVGKRTGKDLDRGKLTYPGLMGIEASRQYAAELTQEAHSALQDFGPEAEPLRLLADQVLNRDR